MYIYIYHSQDVALILWSSSWGGIAPLGQYRGTMFHTERELFVGGDAVHHTSFKWRRLTWTSFHTIFWYLFVPCSYIYVIIYIKYGLVFVYGCLWVKQESSVQSQKRKPPQISGYQGRHTHTHSDLLLLICSKKIKSHKKMNQGPSKRPICSHWKGWLLVPVVG
jgi:hypothetical protein